MINQHLNAWYILWPIHPDVNVALVRRKSRVDRSDEAKALVKMDH